MKLVIDENIAYAKEAFSEFGEVILVNGRIINNNILRNADILIVRSTLNVDEQLLENTNVKFVATVTTGTEHINTDYLKKKHIAFASASGCNADSVAEYVFSTLLNVAVRKKISLQNKTIGIIGIGNIGSRVVKYSEALGLKVLKNDPPKERERMGSSYVTLDEALQADIITLHVPLTVGGIDKTFHLLDETELKKIKAGAILFNTSRGAVINNKALLNNIDRKDIGVVLDVWEEEPFIDVNLVKKVDIGTAHIAGYSIEAKANGTKMIYDALCSFTNRPNNWTPSIPKTEDSEINSPTGGSFEEKLDFIFAQMYKINDYDLAMRKMSSIDENLRGEYFDKLRKDHPSRREFNNYSFKRKDTDDNLSGILKTFRLRPNKN